MRLDLHTVHAALLAGVEPQAVARVLTAAGWPLPDSEDPFPQWLARLDLDDGTADHERVWILALYRFQTRHAQAARDRLVGAAELVAFLATGWSSVEPADLEHAATIERTVKEATAGAVTGPVAAPDLTALIIRLVDELYFSPRKPSP
jgi:hypothetical protein